MNLWRLSIRLPLILSLGLSLALVTVFTGCQNQPLKQPLKPQARIYPALEEPYHKVLFHNDKLDVYSVRMQPGEVSFYHHHSRDQLGIVMRDSTSSNQKLGEPEIEIKAQRGAISYIPHSVTGGYTHRVSISGEKEFWVLGIEFSESAGIDSDVFQSPPEQTQFEVPQGKVYRLTLGPREGLQVSDSLFISMSPGKLTSQSGQGNWVFGEGALKWVGSNPERFINEGNTSVQLVLLTLE